MDSETLSGRYQFTVTNLLVVVFIVAILMVVLTPVLNSTRESARRNACTDNQKQLALAIKTYDVRNRCYPPSAFRIHQDVVTESYIGNDGATVASDVIPASLGNSGTAAPYSMFVKILPDIGRTDIYEQLDLSIDAFDAETDRNTKFADHLIPELICPSFRGARIITSPPYDKVNVAITNYKSYGATTEAVLDVSSAASGVASVLATQAFGPDLDGGGMIHPYGAARAPKVGSHTFLCNETRERTLAAWYDGTTIALFGLLDDNGTQKVGLNNQFSTNPTAVVYATYGGSNKMTWGPSSEHPGITNHSFADGSVHAIPDDIDIVLFRSFITRADNDRDLNWW